MRRLTRLLFILSVLYQPFMAFGQDNNDSFLYFEKPITLQAAGLNSVRCMFKDSRHMMWFGTENGLYRYDGLNLRYFKHNDGDSNSLADNYISQITEDTKGHLWLALVTGITEIDLATLNIRNYTSTNKRFTGNFTNHICLDSDNVWVLNKTSYLLPSL